MDHKPQIFGAQIHKSVTNVQVRILADPTQRLACDYEGWGCEWGGVAYSQGATYHTPLNMGSVAEIGKPRSGQGGKRGV